MFIYVVIVVVFVMCVCSMPVPCRRHKHQWNEFYWDLRPDHDDPNGPRTYHGIGWTCQTCGKTNKETSRW